HAKSLHARFVPARIPGFGQDERLSYVPSPIRWAGAVIQALGVGLLGVIAVILSIPLLAAAFGIPMAVLSPLSGRGFDFRALLIGITGAVLTAALYSLGAATGRKLLLSTAARRKARGRPAIDLDERMADVLYRREPFVIQEPVVTLGLMVA